MFLVIAGVFLLTWRVAHPPQAAAVPAVTEVELSQLQLAVEPVNAELADLWKRHDVAPAEAADDLTVLRRLSLALHGTVPSLEQVRAFEADTRPDRLDHWTDDMLDDRRFADYFAERLGRSYVGVEGGQFIIFRRDRFKAWLADELQNHTPYDEIVQQMISAEGVWTGDGEVNFLTSGFADGEFDPNKITARTVRAFLGQRMDCAQCHNHPFDHWKQSEFEGLAAYYGKVSLSMAGVTDNRKMEFRIKADALDEGRVVEPSVPFNPEWRGTDGTPREQLARWMTHPENKRFERAIANRVWGLMFGKPFLQHLPVDDLPDPDTNDDLKTLDLLGAEFRAHDCDLRWLIRTIAATDAFRLSSTHPLATNADLARLSPDEIEERKKQVDQTEEYWAVFPLVRLRPEQVIGSMIQSTNIHTVDQNSHLIIRILRFARENDFVREFGDPGVDELQDRVGTIPQALLRMNGNLSRELTEPGGLLAPGRIASVSPTPEAAVNTAFMACLSRNATTKEIAYFAEHERWEKDRGQEIQDLYWTLFNSPEFSWNH
ncbi:MAG: DUF1549 domain-containing protein [Planctomycetaceae bacterium]|nr:DUF1549 domain-containing protein [Planctomycetaceae bacterium]MCB9951121.1 DUF1549 domain-containing protein [Planctomycetaceae bacterium]